MLKFTLPLDEYKLCAKARRDALQTDSAWGLLEEEEGHGGKMDSTRIAAIHSLMVDVAGRDDLLFLGMLFENEASSVPPEIPVRQNFRHSFNTALFGDAVLCACAALRG